MVQHRKVDIRHLDKSDITRISEIDRSEHVTLSYVYRDGKLENCQVDWHVPRWFTDGREEHSVQALIDKCVPILKESGVLFGALDGDVLAGLAILRYKLSGTMSQLALLHVSRAHRRQGIATRLFQEACQLARADGAEELYVSATPSESAVGFYLSQGCQLAEQVNEELYAEEPEDIHMIKML